MPASCLEGMPRLQQQCSDFGANSMLLKPFLPQSLLKNQYITMLHPQHGSVTSM